MLRSAALASRRGRIDAQRLSLQQSRFADPLQYPVEDRGMGLDIDQSPRSGKGGVIRRRFTQLQSQKLAQPQRIGRPPRDSSLRTQAFEIAHQQQPKVRTRFQTRPPHPRGIEFGAPLLDEIVKLILLQKVL